MHKPKPGDRIRVTSRLEDGKASDGEIIIVSHEDEEVIVRYRGNDVVYGRGFIRKDGIMYPDIVTVLVPDFIYKGGDTDSFYFDDLNWNSSEGGEGIWLVN